MSFQNNRNIFLKMRRRILVDFALEDRMALGILMFARWKPCAEDREDRAGQAT